MKAFTPARLPERTIARIPIDCICSGHFQSRRNICENNISALADSIRRHGLLSPLLVRRIDAGKYELIAGERRLRALNLLNQSHADAVVLPAFDRECALLSLSENLHREDLHFLDESEAFRDLLGEHSITQEQLAKNLSLGFSALTNRLRLLKLNSEVRAAVRSCNLSEFHARALLRLNDPKQQLQLIRECADKNLSPGQLESRIEQLNRPLPHRPSASPIIRDNRIIINAILDTVKELNRIGVHVESRIEEHSDSVEVIVRIPAIHKE